MCPVRFSSPTTTQPPPTSPKNRDCFPKEHSHSVFATETDCEFLQCGKSSRTNVWLECGSSYTVLMTANSTGERRCEGEIRSSSFDSINSSGWWLDCRSIDLHVTRNSACGTVGHTVFRKQHRMQANAVQTIWSVRVADWRASGGTWYYCAHAPCTGWA